MPGAGGRSARTFCVGEEEEDAGRDTALEVLDAARRRSGGSAGDELAAGWRGVAGARLLFFGAWGWGTECSDFLCWTEEEEDAGRDAALEALDAASRRSGGSAGDELAAGWRGFGGSPLIFFSTWRWSEGAKDLGRERKRHVSVFFFWVRILDNSALGGPCRHYNKATAASELWKNAAADRELHAKVAYPAAWARRDLKFKNRCAPPYDGIHRELALD